MIEGLISRIKVLVITAAAVMAILLGAYFLGGRSARRAVEIKNQHEDNKRLHATVEVKNDVTSGVRRMDGSTIDTELAANWMRD